MTTMIPTPDNSLRLKPVSSTSVITAIHSNEVRGGAQIIVRGDWQGEVNDSKFRRRFVIRETFEEREIPALIRSDDQVFYNWMGPGDQVRLMQRHPGLIERIRTWLRR